MRTERLHILAIEPFYCGARRLMLESIARRSRHRWTILRLPGRRIERRLEAAAQWFAEVILRRPAMDFDVLFTSEAINLPELYQLCPEVSGHPAVVYFHDNQLPCLGRGGVRPIDHVNLLTATEATEVWFNSLHHLRSFTGRAMGLFRQVPQYFAPDALVKMTRRCVLVPPPVELNAVRELESDAGFSRNPRAMFVDLRQADTALLAGGLSELKRRGEAIELVTMGPRGDLPAGWARTSIPDHDEDGTTFAMARCGTYLSTQTDCSFDPRAIMAMASGMRAALPDCGAYQEIVPSHLQPSMLFQPRPEFLASTLQDIWALPELTEWNDDLRDAVAPYTAATAVEQIDLKLANLASVHPAHVQPAASGLAVSNS